MIEDRGLESLWFAEHSHLPVGKDRSEGGDGGGRYAKTFDPFVAVTAAAAATTLKVATGVCLVPQRDPIHTAKEVATVDVLSDGRVILGVGAGWNRQEMRNHGTDPKTRMRLLTERVQAMIEIWTKDEAEYHGQLVNFDLLQAWPKPVQTPYPPIMVGGAGRTVEDRVLAFGDGWAPMIAGIEDDVFDRFAPLQDRTDKQLELTASGPQSLPPNAHASAGPRRTSGARVAPPGRRWRDQRQRHRTIPRRRRGQHTH
jgi:probable F420-dependent oxidoreductase